MKGKTILATAIMAIALSPAQAAPLKPLSSAPHDGTPIVAVYPMTDEGDFIRVIFWTQDGADGYWDSTSDGEFEDSDFLGWAGTAEDVFKQITNEKTGM